MRTAIIKQADGGNTTAGKNAMSRTRATRFGMVMVRRSMAAVNAQATRQQREQDQVEHGGQSLRNVACAGGATAVGLAPGERRSKASGRE